MRGISNKRFDRQIAFHEAGHAVAACASGLGMRKAGIRLMPKHGSTAWRHGWKIDERKNILTCLAGAVSEANWYREILKNSPEFDSARFGNPYDSPSASDLSILTGSLLSIRDTSFTRRASIEAYCCASSNVPPWSNSPLDRVALACWALCSGRSTSEAMALLSPKGQSSIIEGTEDWFPLLAEIAEETRNLVQAEWSAIQKIAEALLAAPIIPKNARVLSGSEIERLYLGYGRRKS